MPGCASVPATTCREVIQKGSNSAIAEHLKAEIIPNVKLQKLHRRLITIATMPCQIHRSWRLTLKNLKLNIKAQILRF